ncbi:MAG TPA: cytochrome c [Pyrinomonadaceae bacterium]|nr:cytochrome c [Pyrinomonadaceae bacterium]
MNSKQLKLKLAAILFMLPLITLVVFNSRAVPTSAAQEFDAAAAFKAKCAMCHGPKAEKKFDASKSDDELLQTVLKSGKPGMPAFESKGITVDQAKAIIAHMKSLHQQ